MTTHACADNRTIEEPVIIDEAFHRRPSKKSRPLLNDRLLSGSVSQLADGGFVEGFRALAGVRKPHMQEPAGRT